MTENCVLSLRSLRFFASLRDSSSLQGVFSRKAAKNRKVAAKAANRIQSLQGLSIKQRDVRILVPAKGSKETECTKSAASSICSPLQSC